LNDRECPSETALYELAGIAPTDPRMSHVEACPRCAAKLAAYEAYLQGDAPAEARPQEARRTLDSFIEREIVGAAGEADAIEREAGLGPEPRGFVRRLTAWWTSPAARPAVAFAVLAMVAIASLWLVRRSEIGTPVMRGDTRPGATFMTTGPVTSHQGSLELSWNSVPGAERYEVEILDQNLDLLLAQTTTDTTLILGNLPTPDGVTAPTTWRVIAQGGGRDMARSRPEPLPRP